MNNNTTPVEKLSIGTQLIIDMGNCSEVVHKLNYIERVCDRIIEQYGLNIMCKHIEKFGNTEGCIAAYVFQGSQQLTVRSYNKGDNKILFDLYLANIPNLMEHLKMIKEEVLRAFEPRSYRVSFKPRGYVTSQSKKHS